MRFDAYYTRDWLWDIKDLLAELAALRLAGATAQQQIEQWRVRAIVAEQHKTLSLLGKSSWQEVVEEQLRVKLAETEVRAEAAEADRDRLIARVQQLVEQWRAKGAECDSYHATMGIGWKACADQVDAALTE